MAAARRGGFTDSVATYTPNTDVWTHVAPLSTPRAGLGATLGPDGRIYAIGGATANGASDAVEVYTPTTNTWAPVAPLPRPAYSVYDGAATGADGHIYVFGGYYGGTVCNEILITRVLVYSPRFNKTEGPYRGNGQHRLAPALPTKSSPSEH